MNNASLKRLLYGCWEMKDNGKPPIAPIIDMTEMIPLLDWAYGVKNYQETGNASLIQSLTNKEAESLKNGVTYEEANALLTLADRSHDFHQMMQTCRAPEIPQGLDDLRDALNRAKTMEIRGFRPFEKLFGKMNDKIKGFTGRPIMDDYLAAKWCFENGLIQQGYTMLQEGIISAVCRVMGIHINKRGYRTRISSAVRQLVEETEQKKRQAGDTVDLVINFLTPYKNYLSSYGELTDYRNSMNHAGWNEDDLSHEEFHKKLHEFLQFFRPFFEEMDKLYQTRQEGSTNG